MLAEAWSRAADDPFSRACGRAWNPAADPTHPLPPARESLVYQVSNHEVMGCPEHQSRLSKRAIAKVFQRNELGVSKAASYAVSRQPRLLRSNKKSHRYGGLLIRQVYDLFLV